MSETRKDGIYWVKDHVDGQWKIAKWEDVQNWWVLAWVELGDPAFPDGVCTDARFTEIGPRVFPPKS